MNAEESGPQYWIERYVEMAEEGATKEVESDKKIIHTYPLVKVFKSKCVPIII